MKKTRDGERRRHGHRDRIRFSRAGKTTFLKQYLPPLHGKTVVIEKREYGGNRADGDLIQSDIPVKEIMQDASAAVLAVDFGTDPGNRQAVSADRS